MLRKILCGAMVAAAVATSAPADAAVTYIVAGAATQVTGTYATPVVVAPVGGPLTFRNQDVQVHSVVAEAAGPADQPWCKFFTGDCPLFWTPVTDAGGRESAVKGIENAVSGESYGFYCVVHKHVKGTLVTV